MLSKQPPVVLVWVAHLVPAVSLPSPASSNIPRAGTTLLLPSSSQPHPGSYYVDDKPLPPHIYVSPSVSPPSPCRGRYTADVLWVIADIDSMLLAFTGPSSCVLA